MTPDGKSLDQLARSGSDLEQLHEFEFTLRFTSQRAAESAEVHLLGLAFKTTVQPGDNASQWLLRGTKVMYPVESNLQGLRDKLEDIARLGRGTYLGWTAKPFVREPAE